MTSSKKRYNPPSEDFAETKQKLKAAEATISQQVEDIRHLTIKCQELTDMLSDVLDDVGKQPPNKGT